MSEGNTNQVGEGWRAPSHEASPDLTAQKKAEILYPDYIPSAVDFIASNGVVVNIKSGIVKIPKNIAALGKNGMDLATEEYLRAYPLSEDELKG